MTRRHVELLTRQREDAGQKYVSQTTTLSSEAPLLDLAVVESYEQRNRDIGDQKSWHGRFCQFRIISGPFLDRFGMNSWWIL